MENSYQSNKLEFQQIVLSHLSKISTLSLQQGNRINFLLVYQESIEVLSDILCPFFDEKMKKAQEEFNKNLLELKENIYSDDFLSKKKSIYRSFFRELNLLLNRNDYLKSSIYGEESTEQIVNDDVE